jgi:predicted ATPase
VSALPNPLTQLVGREADVASVYGLVTSGETRLVTLTGPGGVGKTRLALEVARRFDRESPGRATFIALAAADSPSTVASTIAQRLGILDTGDVPLEQKLVASVASREGLVVLDNFEQVVEAAPVVVAMLEAAPGLRFLVTSRVLLRVLGESNYPVRPLELPDQGAAAWQPRGPVAPAVELFVERARAVVPDFEVTPENADAVGRIVAALDGLPLAIELAAARIGLLSPAVLLERLDRQLSVLVGGRRDAPARHQTVRNAIEWSPDLLTGEERSLLWQLGVFAGPSSLGAVEAVASVDANGRDVLALVGALVDASLVRQQERHGRPYLSLLATVREYALERLEASGQLAAARSRHGHYYARWAVRLHADLLGPGQRERLAELTDEGDNLRAATQQMVEAHDWDSLAELSFALYPYWWLVGLLGEVRDRLDELLSSGDPVSDRATAIALWLVAIITYFAGGQASTESLERSARLFASVGDLVGEGNALTTLGLTYETADPPDLVRARQTLDRALGLLHESGDVWSETVALIPMGRLYVAEGDLAGATAQFARALQLGEEQENDFAIALALNGLGWMTLFTGQVAEAAVLMERALDLTIGLSYEHGIAYQLESLLAVAGMLGDVERAGLLAGAAQALRERIGLFNPSDAVLHLPVVERIRNGPGVQVYERSVKEGRHLSLDAAISVARAVSAAAAEAGAGG